MFQKSENGKYLLHLFDKLLQGKVVEKKREHYGF